MDSGQAMVEFMLVITFIVVVFVSVIQMVLLMYAYNTLADAAKEGVRYAIVHGTKNSNCSGPSTSAICTTSDTVAANVKTAVFDFAAVSAQSISKNTDITVTYPEACSNPGCLVRVEIHHQYTPLFGLRWPSVTINAAADGRIMN